MYESTFAKHRDNWDATAGSWVPDTDLLNEYDNNGFRTAQYNKSNWNATGAYFNTHNREEYVCTLISVGIEDVAESKVRVYPNPVTKGDILTINTAEATNYMLLDNAGRNIRSGMMNEGINTISTNDLSAGFYFLKLNNSTHKIILQ